MHKSVLLSETIDNLNIIEDGVYVDATLGFGGHSGLILEKIKRGFLFAFDQDDMALVYSEKKLKEKGNNFEIIKSNFVFMKEELNKRNITKVDGIIFDLGVSSPQLDEGDRGFSFHKDARLDMRMDTSKKLSAYEVVNEYSYEVADKGHTYILASLSISTKENYASNPKVYACEIKDGNLKEIDDFRIEYASYNTYGASIGNY